MMVYMMMIDSPEDQSKFEKIYLKYRGLMYQIAYGVLHNKQDAEDAVHQAFVKIAEHIEEIDVAVCPITKGFVVTIAENKAIDIYRKKQRHPQVEYCDALAGMTVEYNGSNALAACMAKLPARERELVLLKYKYGYNNDEVAKLMGLTKSNAIKIDQRAKKKLRELCMEEGLL